MLMKSTHDGSATWVPCTHKGKLDTLAHRSTAGELAHKSTAEEVARTQQHWQTTPTDN